VHGNLSVQEILCYTSFITGITTPLLEAIHIFCFGNDRFKKGRKIAVFFFLRFNIALREDKAINSEMHNSVQRFRNNVDLITKLSIVGWLSQCSD
jgi:hypothetical protein